MIDWRWVFLELFDLVSREKVVRTWCRVFKSRVAGSLGGAVRIYVMSYLTCVTQRVGRVRREYGWFFYGLFRKGGRGMDEIGSFLAWIFGFCFIYYYSGLADCALLLFFLNVYGILATMRFYLYSAGRHGNFSAPSGSDAKRNCCVSFAPSSSCTLISGYEILPSRSLVAGNSTDSRVECIRGWQCEY